MEDYEVGALGDLISSSKSPGKSVLQKSFNKTPKKGTPNSKQNGAANGKQNGKQTPQKRKSAVDQNKNSAKKIKNNVEDEDDEEDEDEAENSMGEEESDADEEASDVEEEEGSINSDEDLDEEEDDEDEDEDDDDSEDDAPEEKSSKNTQPKTESNKELYADRTIFVGNVKVGTQKKAFIQRFKQYGAVETVRLRSIAVENPKLGKRLSIQKNKLHAQRDTCNGYVRFVQKESALKAVEAENGKEWNGLHLRVTMSDASTLTHDNKRTLFVGNLSFKAEDEALWKAFESCGEIDSVRIVRDKHTNVSKGFAYINFKSADSIQLALEMGEVTIDNRVLRLSASEFAKKEKKLDPSNDCCVFVGGFSAGTPKDVVLQAFQKIGPVAKVRLVKDKHSKKPSGCGFVTFKNSEAADKALKATIKVNDAVVDVQTPRTTLKGSKKAMAASPNSSPVKGQGKGKKNQSGRIDKSWRKDEKRRSGGGSPPKSFQGSQGIVKGGKKQKKNKGDLMKKKMAQKVAPKA